MHNIWKFIYNIQNIKYRGVNFMHNILNFIYNIRSTMHKVRNFMYYFHIFMHNGGFGRKPKQISSNYCSLSII